MEILFINEVVNKKVSDKVYEASKRDEIKNLKTTHGLFGCQKIHERYQKQYAQQIGSRQAVSEQCINKVQQGKNCKYKY